MRWEYRDDSSNKDYQNAPSILEMPGTYRRLMSRGEGSPKFLLYVAKDYSSQIIGLRWELTNEYDPTLQEHRSKRTDLTEGQPIFKLWNHQITGHPLPRNMTLNQYIDLLDQSQIQEIFHEHLSDEDFSFTNIDTPHRFLTYQNTNNSNRQVLLFDSRSWYDAINKQVMYE